MTSKNKTRTTKRQAPSWLTTERVIVGGSIGATVLVLVIIFLSSYLNNQARNATIEGVVFYPLAGGQHVSGHVNYPQTPPVGGPHNQVWQNCGVYTVPVVNEHAVHSLEHGAVWITYDPAVLSQDQVDRLASITRESSHRLLSPYPGIDSPVIASSWGYQLKLDSIDDSRLMQFILKYEQGPTTPEPGATCSGGTSSTTDDLQ